MMNITYHHMIPHVFSHYYMIPTNYTRWHYVMLYHCLIICFLFFTSSAWSADLPNGDAMAEEYLRQQVARISTNFLQGARRREEWEAQLPRLRSEYLEMLGLAPLPEKTDLKVTITGTIERDGVVIDKLHFQSRPGLYVTGNLYRPKDNSARLPTILYVCGHSNRGRDGNKTAFQEHGAWFAQHGYNCLIIDTLQLGEVAGHHHGTYRLNRWWWQSRGYTPAGVECWNGIRAIDYLVSRPDVDPERIGVTGISGGGAATIWIAAADPRVRVAVPVSGMSDLESYVSNKIVNGHCDCMFMVNTYAWEWTTIAALIAPRPMLFANSDNDPIFPMDGNRRIIERLRKIYEMYQQSDRIAEYVSQGGHDYRPDLRVAIFAFFNKHLKGDTSPVTDVKWSPLPGKELRVFAEDSDLPRDALNDRIDETFVPLGRPELPPPGQFDSWKKQLMERLRAVSFRDFPERVPMSRVLDDWSDEDSSWRCVTEAPWAIRVQWTDGAARQPAAWVVLGEEDKPKGVPKWAEDEFAGDVFACWPRGCGVTAWTRKNPPNYVERSFVLVGQTVDQRRVWDAIASFRDFQRGGRDRQWIMTGRKQAGIIAAYAALFEPDVSEVVLYDPPKSHHEGPHFLNVLRVLDIPDALGLLAPRPLTIHTQDEKAFERTAEIYRRAGAANRLRFVKPSK
jgi:dienelactone hydrolase